jgi:hypothetical protein
MKDSMGKCNGVREVGYLDCAGGGQIVVEGNYAYIGHIEGPAGTTVVDVSDPKHPRTVWERGIPQGLHSHKVRVANDLMLINHEFDPMFKGSRDATASTGIGIYDVSNPAKPKPITFWNTVGSGVHRFTFDGRYAYLSPTMEGYRNNIVVILDLADPAKPVEVGRWWMPGQWTAGGEPRTFPDGGAIEPRCHHPIRRGDRLYVSYWHGGGFILDISDMSKPKTISHIDYRTVFPWPTHSLVPIPFPIHGHKWMLVADEDLLPRKLPHEPQMHAFLWMWNITDETKPVPVGSFQVEGVDGSGGGWETGCHQPVEEIIGTEVPCAWFAQGLRIIDISNPHTLREVASFMPEPAGSQRVCSNDVFQDARGLIYLIDRYRGLHIVERTV